MIKISTKHDDDFSTDVALYRNMVYRLAFNYTGNRFDADDITQEVFIKLYNKRNFTEMEHKKAFLIRATINASKNMLKSLWRKKRTDFTELDNTLSYRESFNEDEEELRGYLMLLKPKYRTVIYFYYYEGYSAAETAKILKLSEANVKTQLHRARSQLKTIITDERNGFIHEGYKSII